MKVSTTILMASAVALASTIYARPTLLKRIADATDTAVSAAGAVACLIQLTVAPVLSPACQSEFAKDVGLVKGATLSDLTIDMSVAVPTIASSDISVELLTAVGLPSIPVSRARLNVAITDGGQSASSISSVWLSAKTIGNSLDVGLTATALTFTPEQLPVFDSFLKAIGTRAFHTFSLVGSVDVELSISLPSPAKALFPFAAALPTLPAKTITIPGVGISVPITLGSLNDFGGEIQSRLSSVSAVANVGGVDTLQFKIAVTNPSTITIKLGDVDFQVWSSDATPVLVGIASVANMILVPGGVNNNLDVVLKANTGVALSNYFPAKDGLKLVINGYDQSSKNPIATAAALNMKLNLVFKN